MHIVSVLHQNEGGIGKSIPDAQEISRDPRDFPRAKPEGNLEGLGKSRGRRGWISQYLPSFGGVWTFSSSSIHLQGWIRKIHPCGQGRIDSVRINPSLLRMRERSIHPHRVHSLANVETIFQVADPTNQSNWIQNFFTVMTPLGKGKIKSSLVRRHGHNFQNWCSKSNHHGRHPHSSTLFLEHF